MQKNSLSFLSENDDYCGPLLLTHFKSSEPTFISFGEFVSLHFVEGGYKQIPLLGKVNQMFTLQPSNLLHMLGKSLLFVGVKDESIGTERLETDSLGSGRLGYGSLGPESLDTVHSTHGDGVNYSTLTVFSETAGDNFPLQERNLYKGEFRPLVKHPQDYNPIVLFDFQTPCQKLCGICFHLSKGFESFMPLLTSRDRIMRHIGCQIQTDLTFIFTGGFQTKSTGGFRTGHLESQSFTKSYLTGSDAIDC